MAEATLAKSRSRRNILDPKARSEVIRRYLAGERDVDLAREYGLSRSGPATAARNAGHPPRARKPRCTANHAAFSVLTPESAYWIGFLMADGSILKHRAGRYVSASCAASDGEHLESLKRFLSATHKINVWKRGPWKGYQRQDLHKLSIRSDRLADDLARYGVVPRKTGHEVAAESLLRSRHFWRGLVDGDGHIGIQTDKRTGNAFPVIGLCSAGETILHQFLAYVRSFVVFRGSLGASGDGVKTVTITGRAATCVIAALYSDATVALKRKASKAALIRGLRSAV